MTTTNPVAPPGLGHPWQDGISANELDIIEHGGRELFSDYILSKHPKTGALKRVPVRVKLPRSADFAQATVDAIMWVGKMIKRKDLDKAGAAAIVGEVRFEDMDTICVLSRIILEPEPPHGRYMLPDLLDENHDRTSLYDLWDRVDFYGRLVDPRLSDIDDQTFWGLIAAIDKKRNLSPLVVLGGSSRDSFLLSMAVQLQSYKTGPSSSDSTEPSTQAP